MPQHIHRFAVVEELPTKDGVKVYSATLSASPELWTLLKWTPPSATAIEAQSGFLDLTQGWPEQGVEAFAYRGDLCVASQNAFLLETKISLLRQSGFFGTIGAGPMGLAGLPPVPPTPPREMPASPPAQPPVNDTRLAQMLAEIENVKRAMESWRRVALAAADRDLKGDAGELWQLSEQVKTARTFDIAFGDVFVRTSRSVARKVVFAADTSVDPKRIDPQVQNAVTQAVAAARLELVDPPLNSDPRQSAAIVRGLRCGAEILHPPEVPVWDATALEAAPGVSSQCPAPPQQPVETRFVVRSSASPPPAVPPRKAKSSWKKALGLAGLIGFGGVLFVVRGYFGNEAGPKTQTTPQLNAEPVAIPAQRKQTAIFRDPVAGVEFTYPRPTFEKTRLAEPNEVVRLKSAQGVIISVTIAPTGSTDTGEAIASEYGREFAASGRTITYKTGVKPGWYVVSGFEGSNLFYRRVLNPPGYIAAMTISHRRDVTPPFNPASVIAQTFKIVDVKL